MSGVLDYILHRPPMVFIDELISHDDDRAVATLTVRSELMFCEKDGLPTWVGIEIMAQTISLYAGVQGKKSGNPPKLGFLLGTRKMTLPCSHFGVGQILTVVATRQYVHDNLGVFDCQISMDDEVCMSATLSVYEPAEGEFV